MLIDLAKSLSILILCEFIFQLSGDISYGKSIWDFFFCCTESILRVKNRSMDIYLIDLS